MPTYTKIKWLAIALIIAPLLWLIGSETERGGNARLGISVALALMTVGAILTVFMFQAARKSGRNGGRTEDYFMQFVEGVRDTAIYMLDADGRVIRWNEGAKAIKGYSQEEIEGQHYSLFFADADQQAGAPAAALQAALRDGRFEDQGWRVRKDGSRFYAGTVLRSMRDKSGRLIGFAGITRDNTELLERRESQDQARSTLVQSQKMEALGKLTGGIAHDFNNLLHVIKNCVEILYRLLPVENAEAVKMLDVIKRNADRAANLTHRLLAFARVQPATPKPVSPNKLVAGVYELLHQTLGENVELELKLGSGDWNCAIDANQLEIAILNLAINARDAMPRGGKLTIATTDTVLDQSYLAAQGKANPDAKAGEYVLIAVRDTGTGMSPEIAARAFEPFFTTKEEGRGTGLGLSQVHGFIKHSGGHMTIASEPGNGTTVKLYLPRVVEDAEPGIAGASPQPV